MRPSETFLGQPIRSLQSMLRFIAKQNPEYERIVPDGIYGPETMSAVSRFQQNHGIPATGVTNQETWDAIAEEYESAMVEMDAAEALNIFMNPNQKYCKGNSDPNIYVVQAMLMALSDVCDSIGSPSMNGMMDDATADSITSFQQLCGLPMNGQMDKTTWKNLALQYPMAASMKTQG